MLLRARKPGSFAALGIVSSFAMPAGTFQYGLNTTCVIWSAKIGVLLSGSPDDHAHVQHRLAVFDRLEPEVGHVHDESGGRAWDRAASASARVELDGANALFDRHIQRADGRRLDDAVGSMRWRSSNASRVGDVSLENRTWIFFVRWIESPSIASRWRSVGTTGDC